MHGRVENALSATEYSSPKSNSDINRRRMFHRRNQKLKVCIFFGKLPIEQKWHSLKCVWIVVL